MPQTTPTRPRTPPHIQLTSRLRTYVAGLPLLTVAVATCCAAVYVVDALFWFGELAKWWELRTERVVYGHQVYRLSTYPLPHLNLPHLLFNLAFFLPLCSSAERHTGTLPLAVVLCSVCTFLPALLYCAAMLGLGVLGTGTAAFVERDVVVGISGWIFAMAVGELADETRNGGERRIFGIVRVPPFIYPIFLLLFLEWIIPGSSFLGHLCALSSGYLYTYGYISKLLPSTELYQRLEGSRALAPLTVMGGFVSVDHARTYLPLFNMPDTDMDVPATGGGRAGVHTISALPTYAPPAMATVATAPSVAPTPSFPGVGQRLGD